MKGFTDGLRIELETEGAPVAVTLIQPASIDTTYPLHAKNYMDRQAKHGPPAYAPDTVARAILHCCATPERAVVVGGGGRVFIGIDHWTPPACLTVTWKAPRRGHGRRYSRRGWG